MDRFRIPNLLFMLKFVLFCWVLLRFESTLVVVVGQQQQQSLTLPFERLALIQLRSSLGIRARDWPIKPDPCSVWRGIQCRNGSVIGINVSGFRRTRIGAQNPQFAVDALGNLTNLVSFNASLLALPGQIPDLFGQRLGNLEVLDLHSCSVSGSIPLSLGNLSKLNILDLSHNNISGVIPSTLGQLVNLSILDLSHNSLSGSIPGSFSSLTNVSFLDISSNFLSGTIPRGIGVLRNLRTLNFSSNGLTSSIPSQLGDLSNLVDLDVSFNSLVGPIPSDMRGLRSLQTMDVGNNSLSGSLPDDLFPVLTRLEIVVLSHNNFSGPIPNSLWLIPTLQFVDFSGNNFTGILPNNTLTGNSTSAILDLSNNEYYGELTSVLQRFGSIDLTGNYFEGKVPLYMDTNAFLNANCLQNVTDQRSEDECSSFYSSKGLVFDNFGIPSTNSNPAPSRRSNHRRMIILASVLGGVGLLLLLLLILLFIFICARRKNGTRQIGNGVGPIPQPGPGPPSPGVSINFSSVGESFTYQQLLDATNNFGDLNLIKNGHSGDLFRGVLEGGIPVVIKKINLNSIKRESYLVELDFFSKVSHPRLVPLLGHCLDQANDKYLVYKYMPNADLSSSLYRKVNSDDNNLQSLDWITRLKIAIGAAEGLSYLHHECSPPFVHR